MTIGELIETLKRIEILQQMKRREGSLEMYNELELHRLLSMELQEVKYDEE